MVCETCEGEIDLPEDLESGTGICRQCGIAFLVDAPYEADRASRHSA
jgi:transcription initiation factor TFIIIB Brf1 subunit/transcription initiation factor TFIIB